MGQANPRRAHKPAAPLRGRAVAIITSTLYSADPAFERGSFFGKKILVIVTSIFFSVNIIQPILQQLLLLAGSCEAFQRCG
jgi:hypothetical protein